MGVLKLTSGVLAVLAVSLLVVGGLGFTSVAAERGVDVAVVSDENAFVGYETNEISVSSGDRVDLVTVTNRLPGDIEVEEVTISGDEGMTIANVSEPAIPSGESRAVDGTISCQTPNTTDIDVTISVAGNGVWVKLFGASRSFTVSCSPGQGQNAAAPPSFVPSTDSDDNGTDTQAKHGVWFSGTGNAVLYHENDSVTVTVWGYTADADLATTESHNITELASQSIRSGEPIRDQIGPGNAVTIVAVTLENEGTTYVHPQFDVGTGTYDGAPKAGWGDSRSTVPSVW